MLRAGFEPAIPASERPHTHALDHTATGIAEVLLGIKLFRESLVMLIKISNFHSEAPRSLIGDIASMVYY